MANDDWKYKELPKAAGETAPAKLDQSTNEWIPFSTEKTFVKHSEESKPKNAFEGDSLVLYDTKQVFIYDGKEWREL